MGNLERKNTMNVQLGDILVMKKAHPCGEKQWLVLRTGADFRLRCLGCNHEIMVPRFKAEKNIRNIIPVKKPSTETNGS